MFLQVLCKLLNTRAYSRYLVFGRTHVLVVAHEVLRSAVVRVISPPCSFAAGEGVVSVFAAQADLPVSPSGDDDVTLHPRRSRRNSSCVQALHFFFFSLLAFCSLSARFLLAFLFCSSLLLFSFSFLSLSLSLSLSVCLGYLFADGTDPLLSCMRRCWCCVKVKCEGLSSTAVIRSEPGSPKSKEKKRASAYRTPHPTLHSAASSASVVVVVTVRQSSSVQFVKR
mmetsp:Transcript_12960/g.24539  ORF Transcript_12960/g.24539 Transcript_12960/m.24539 type:complete len:225 (-) Transcript_12960:1374-2048(-)